MATILVDDGDATHREAVAAALSADGHAVVATGPADVTVAGAPEGTLAITAAGEPSPFASLPRSVGAATVAQLVGRALDCARLARESLALRPRATPSLVGGSAGMEDVREGIARSINEPTVLIQGERGTGKATAAQAIHAAGSRADRPLVVVDCAAVDDVTLAADLFDAGRLRHTRGATVLLREVAATGPVVQAALSAALRAGDADVRLLATTSHDLRQLVNDGDFSGELLDCLSGTTIVVPPLRDRPQDVPDLCRHFLSVAARRERRAALEPEPTAVQLMQAYAWPRNVRELRNFIDRAYLVGGTDNPLRAGLIEPWLRIGSIDPVAATVEALAGQPLADIEKRVILTTLQQFRGHRIKTAGALGIGVRTLGIKLKRWRDEGDAVVPAGRTDG